MGALELIAQCRKMGAILTPVGNDRLKIRAPEPLPDDLVNALSQDKPRIIRELQYQLSEDAKCWLLSEWRRISIPEWRKILQESNFKHDLKREKYARWMLREILEDPDYAEER